jgi:hypothetical protein
MRDFMRMLARRLGAIVAECNDAQRRMTMLTTSTDRTLLDPSQAPGSYREFLLRTSGLLMHEPPAARRSARQTVR